MLVDRGYHELLATKTHNQTSVPKKAGNTTKPSGNELSEADRFGFIAAP